MPVMKSLRAFRLASTAGGHVIEVEANTPVFIPDAIVSEALAAGMTPSDAPAPVAEAAPPAPPETIVEDEEVELEDEDKVEDEEAAAAEAAAKQAVEVEQAVLRLITRGDDNDFKADGTPKVNRVNAELPPEVDRATATQVAEVYERLQENVNLAE